eukprot:7387356-Prymnesium_polylepis.1
MGEQNWAHLHLRTVMKGQDRDGRAAEPIAREWKVGLILSFTWAWCCRRVCATTRARRTTHQHGVVQR